MVKHVRERARSQTAQGQKVKAKARSRENIQEKGTTTRAGSPFEDGQHTLGDFGKKRQRVEFVGDVQENGFETSRLDRAAHVFCVQECKSVMRDSTELASSSTKVFDGERSQRALMKNSISQRERCFSPLDVEMIDQLSTLEVLYPRVQ